MRALIALALGLVLSSAGVLAQTTTAPPPSGAPAPSQPPAQPESSDDNAWSFSAAAYTYIVPDDDNYVQPTVTADRGWLHLEARFNYEALETGSAWVGYNFGGGETVTWEITPMIGGIFGETSGVAPGYKGSLGWWKLELYSEGEQVFDADDSSDSFFYNWSELSLSPVDGFRFGLVTQRTRAYDTERDIQRGLLVGITYKQLDASVYLFNPDDEDPTVVVAVGVSF